MFLYFEERIFFQPYFSDNKQKLSSKKNANRKRNHNNELVSK